nr:hypothetical protein [Cylindrotheca closterium]
MPNNKKELFKLLKYSKQLRNNNKYLFKEDPEKSDKLLTFLVIIETNLHVRQKNKYIELIDIFLNNKIDAEDFSDCFIAQYDSINQTLREMEKDFEKRFTELSNFLTDSRDHQIGTSLMWMYDYCYDFNPNSTSSITDAENLRSYAKTLLSELKRT